MINRRITILMVTVSLLFLSGQIFAVNAIRVSKIDGSDSTSGGLMANTPIRYYVHFQVGQDTIFDMANGFKIYSPDSANWQPLVLRELVMFSSYFAESFLVSFSNGMGIDNLSLGAIHSGANPALVPGSDTDIFLIETSLSEEHVGKTLCLDSSQFDVTPWIWATDIFPYAVVPAWDGPHCYEIVDCCVGNRGDINGDGKGPNILDLTRLVDYIFRGFPAPDCKLESDVNGDGRPYNIIDLTFVVDFVFRGGSPAPACPI